MSSTVAKTPAGLPAFLLKEVILLLVLLSIQAPHLLAQHKVYVSARGNDKNKGTVSSPFLSVQQAVTYSSRLQGDVIIALDKGIYYLNQTIEIDNTFKPRSLTIQNNSKGAVVISAGRKIKPAWKLFKNGIYVTPVETTVPFERLYCNGALQVLARYPNYDPAARVFNGTAADAIADNRVTTWAHPEGGYIHALHPGEWGGFHYRFTGIGANGQLNMEGGWQNNRPNKMHTSFRFVENIFEELDAPGEWFLDKEKKLLYFYPDAATDLQTATIEVAHLKESFIIRGSLNKPVKNIIFSGLHFMHNERTFMDTKEPLLRSDWTFYRGGAIVFDGAEHCKVTDCTLENLGGNAIVFSNYNKNNSVTGCHIYNIGASAIAFVGDMAAVRSPAFGYENYVPYDQLDKTAGPLTYNFPQNCLVDNNLLHDLGQIEKQATGVQIEVASAITISRNSIYNLPRAGINIGDGCFGGHLIAFNDVFNTVRETGDHGSFNSWGRDRYWAHKRHYMDSLVAIHPELILLDAQKTTIIRNNRWRCDHGWDVDLDDGSSNYHIYNNLFLNGGLKFREGFYRKAENNIMVNNTFHPHVWFKNSNDVFKHNIVMKPYAPIGVNDWGMNIDSNLFPNQAALATARGQQTDQHSVSGAPLFINPEKGDFRVQPNSPALKIGFKNFAMNAFGVQKPALKKIALQPEIPALLRSDITNHTTGTVRFLGGTIKSVDGLGDRSAYGLPDASGVIIINAGKGLLLQSRLEAKDVILSANGKKIHNVQELLNLYESIKNFNATIDILVMRSQQQLQLQLKTK